MATGISTLDFKVIGLSADVVYKFRVQAQNAIGYSLDSNEVSIRASAVPDTPVAPTTTQSGDSNLVISWGEPGNGGSDVTGYIIKIKQQVDGTLTEDTTNCDGTDSAIKLAKSCTVPISVLRAAPYSLDWGNSVTATVIATNLVGNSIESAEGNGAIIYTYPDPPTSAVNDPLVTSASTLKVMWTAPSFIGGTAIIDYRVLYTLTGSSAFTVLAENIATEYYSTTALQAGSEYKFKIEARNQFGYSQTASNEVTILQAQVPDAPVSLANDVAVTASGVVGLTFADGATDGSSSIIDYTVFYDQGAATATWIELTSGLLTNSYTATGLTTDVVYTFKVYARNIVGLSVASSDVVIRAAAIPAQPAAPTTVVNGVNVDITWVLPDTGGSEILSAKIMIKQADGSFSEEMTNCDGSNSGILAASTCAVPISVLRASPYDQPWGSSIFAKITVTNIVGESLESDEGNGA